MNKQDIYSLLHDPENIQKLLFDYELHSLSSFYVIDSERKEYQTNKKFDSIIDQMAYLNKAYVDGKTIVIKNLEKFIDLTDEFGGDIDIHAYIVPEFQSSGDSFNWHTDDKTVWVKVLWGQKMFALRTKANEITMETYVKLNANQKILISKGQWHKAIPMGPSCLLSVGLPDSNQEDA